MDERTMFLAGEIACLYCDDWMVLSVNSVMGYLEREAIWRHTH